MVLTSLAMRQDVTQLFNFNPRCESNFYKYCLKVTKQTHKMLEKCRRIAAVRSRKEGPGEQLLESSIVSQLSKG